MNKKIIAACVRGAIMFFVLIPGVTITTGLFIDKWLGWSFHGGWIKLAITAVLFGLGCALITWASYELVQYGRGAASPRALPVKLVTRGPYRIRAIPFSRFRRSSDVCC